jgi:adenosylcobinamide-GDP ribazoletransferase
MVRWLRFLGLQLLGAIAFYTCIPIPHHWPLNFSGIARWAPLIGVAIGGGLGLASQIFHVIGLPELTSSALVVGLLVLVTGGLHLDGAMDTADGLAVLDPQRRLSVMSDSHTGAFGAMSVVLILLLKTVALSELEIPIAWGLMTAAAWGRWGQLLAIAIYPYLKLEGKGAFHKSSLKLPGDLLLGSFWVLSLTGLQIGLGGIHWLKAIQILLLGIVISWGAGAWLNRKLGGHTGDTYGAVVEWTEALLLCCLTGI